MPYDRWSMTAEAAEAVTGVAVTDEELEAAEDELVDEIGWRPDPSSYSDVLDETGRLADQRLIRLGRAIAWQAAHRQAKPAKAGDGTVRVTSESIGGGDYSVGYGGSGKLEDGILAPRARRLLAAGGWLARRGAGHTRP